MKRILILQTGGTIAMEIRNETSSEVSDRLCENNLLNHIPQLNELAEIDVHDIFFKDSSDINPNDWQLIIKNIEENYDRYDGFVVLHGTDTMAYTTSALSYSFRNLGKPIIFTGSQVPMTVLRSDATRNLINAVQMATLPFNEVGICFNDKIYRGNRCTKLSIGDFNAYASPNFSPLAEIGLNIEMKYIITPTSGQFYSLPDFSSELLVIRLYPGIKIQLFDSLINSGIRAVIISAFGSGNFPIEGESSLLPFINKCIDSEIFVILASQAMHDSINLNKYKSGRIARDLGCLSAHDMTIEATITKTMHLLANYNNPHQFREFFNKPIAGELTVK